MKLLNLSTALLAPLAAVLLAHPAAAANSRAFGLSHLGHAPFGDGGRPGHGAGADREDRADREPFAVRFSGFLPVDNLQWAPKQEGEPEIRLARCLPTSALSDEAPLTAKGVSEWNRPSRDLAQNGQDPANDSSRSAHAHGGNAKAGQAQRKLHDNGRRGQRGHDKTEGAKHEKNEPEGQGQASGDLPTAPPAAAYVAATPIPEPTTALFGAAVLGVCGLTRRRTRQAPPAS